jgi:hypothetical protein
MQNRCPKPILNKSPPAQFRHIRVELAREPGHLEGGAGFAYVIIGPLDADDLIDRARWRAASRSMPDCAIAARSAGRPRSSRLSSRWRLGFPHDSGAKTPDEVGFHFADERFVPGEYASINEGGKMHTYNVASVARL